MAKEKQVVVTPLNTVSDFRVRHYRHVSNGVELHPQTADFGESNTDKSSYRPDVSLKRSQLGGASLGKQLLYDFEDGKDTGSTIQTLLRSLSLNQVEITQLQQRLEQNVQQLSAQDEAKLKEQLQQQKFDNMDAAVKVISEAFAKQQKASAESDGSSE